MKKSYKPGELLNVPLDDIYEGDNPRTQSWGDLAELGASLLRGQLQPLLVFVGDKGLELIDGARRLRAARLVGMPKLQVLVQPQPEDEARIVANLQREDLSIAEQSAALQELSERGMSASDIADRLGKSRHYVGQTLRLQVLERPWLEALERKHITLGAALLVAQHDEKERERLLKRFDYSLKRAQEDDFDAISVRDIREELHRTMRALASAPFDTSIEIAGVAACSACPKRSGTQGVLFAEIGSDQCLDAVCFEAKVAGAWKIKAATARADGLEVLGPTETDVYGAPNDRKRLAVLDQPVRQFLGDQGVYGAAAQDAPDITVRELLAAQASTTPDQVRPTAIARSKSTITECVPVEAVKAALKTALPKAAKAVEAKKINHSSARAADKAAAERRKREAKKAAELATAKRDAWEAATVEVVEKVEAADCIDRKALFRALILATVGQYSTTEANATIERRGWSAKDGKKILSAHQVFAAQVASASPPTLESILVELTVRRTSSHYYGPAGGSGLELVCAAMGVDVAKHEKRELEALERKRAEAKATSKKTAAKGKKAPAATTTAKKKAKKKTAGAA